MHDGLASVLQERHVNLNLMPVTADSPSHLGGSIELRNFCCVDLNVCTTFAHIFSMLMPQSAASFSVNGMSYTLGSSDSM